MSKTTFWKKNLYENQGFPDNYTDISFLKDLQTNLNVKSFTLLEAINGAARLNLQISLVIGFLIIFYLMYMDEIELNDIMLRGILIIGTGYFVYRRNDFQFKIIKEDAKIVLSVLVFGYLFCPILHTLTDSISTDSTYSMSFFVLCIHIITFDYGIPAFLVSKAISLNAAIFGAVCLSSRLSSSFHAFILLVSSTVIFALCPIFFNKFRSPFWLVPISIICSLFLYNISFSVFIIYMLALIFINLACPLIFVNFQKYKNNIHGPWDEAIVKDLDVEN